MKTSVHSVYYIFENSTIFKSIFVTSDSDSNKKIDDSIPKIEDTFLRWEIRNTQII